MDGLLGASLRKHIEVDVRHRHDSHQETLEEQFIPSDGGDSSITREFAALPRPGSGSIALVLTMSQTMRK